MTRSRTCSAAALLCLMLGRAAHAQAPAPGGHVVIHRQVDADAVRRVGEWLRVEVNPNPSGSLFQDALKLFNESKSKNPREIAEQLKKLHPHLADEGAQNALRQQFDQLRAQAGLPPFREPPATDPEAAPNGTDAVPEPDPEPQTVPGADPVRPAPTPKDPPGPSPPPAEPRNTTPPDTGTNPFADRLQAFLRPKPTPADPPSPEAALGPAPDGGRWVDDETQLAQAAAEEQARRQRQYEALRGFWEKNFGRLDNTPAVRDLIREMIAGPAPLDPETAEGLASLLGDPQADPNALAKWATDQSSLFDEFKVPSLGFRIGDLALPSFKGDPNGGGLDTSFGGGTGPITSEGTWLPVVLFVAIAAGALFVWRFWPRGEGGSARPGPRAVAGLGPWPVDPRRIADREALILAFEYLSVLVCGAGARAWNHVAIADALRTTTGAEEAAEPLARLYALARYAPAGAPLPREAIAEARAHLCRLAGVPAP